MRLCVSSPLAVTSSALSSKTSFPLSPKVMFKKSVWERDRCKCKWTPCIIRKNSLELLGMTTLLAPAALAQGSSTALPRHKPETPAPVRAPPVANLIKACLPRLAEQGKWHPFPDCAVGPNSSPLPASTSFVTRPCRLEPGTRPANGWQPWPWLARASVTVGGVAKACFGSAL